jgi:predicted nucleic acid-binding protein
VAIREPGATHAIGDTGPLISIFQSDSLDLVTTLLPVIHIPPLCGEELVRHGWGESLQSAGSRIESHFLSQAEEEMAWTIAQQIAFHPLSRDPVPDNHLGEAQAIALAARPEFANDVLLLDELAARAVAEEMGLTLLGFAGVLLAAVQGGLLLTADELKKRLESCQRQGTHYSETFIEQVYLAAKGDR